VNLHRRALTLLTRLTQNEVGRVDQLSAAFQFAGFRYPLACKLGLVAAEPTLSECFPYTSDGMLSPYQMFMLASDAL
jgi:hypothetical protein